jgi:hypothetical protein
MENTRADKAIKPNTMVDKSAIVRVIHADITNALKLLDEAYFYSIKDNRASRRLKLIIELLEEQLAKVDAGEYLRM